MRMGDEFVRDSESKFWKEWRATAETLVSEFPPEWREAMIEALGNSAIKTTCELLNEFEGYLDREIERSRRMGHALKSAISALRAMRADGIADDLEELLTSVLRDRQPLPTTVGGDITPVDPAALKWRDVSRGAIPLPVADFTSSLDMGSSAVIRPTPRRGEDDGE